MTLNKKTKAVKDFFEKEWERLEKKYKIKPGTRLYKNDGNKELILLLQGFQLMNYMVTFAKRFKKLNIPDSPTMKCNICGMEFENGRGNGFKGLNKHQEVRHNLK